MLWVMSDVLLEHDCLVTSYHAPPNIIEMIKLAPPIVSIHAISLLRSSIISRNMSYSEISFPAIDDSNDSDYELPRDSFWKDL